MNLLCLLWKISTISISKRPSRDMCKGIAAAHVPLFKMGIIEWEVLIWALYIIYSAKQEVL